jgi:hypothetical protein
MDQHDVTEILGKPISGELLGFSIPARLAYTAVDGDPREVPVAFLWTGGGRIVVCTVTASAKVQALRQNPRVAVTIDTEAFPPKVLLVRGSVHVEVVDGEVARTFILELLGANRRRLLDVR